MEAATVVARTAAETRVAVFMMDMDARIRGTVWFGWLVSKARGSRYGIDLKRIVVLVCVCGVCVCVRLFVLDERCAESIDLRSGVEEKSDGWGDMYVNERRAALVVV